MLRYVNSSAKLHIPQLQLHTQRDSPYSDFHTLTNDNYHFCSSVQRRLYTTIQYQLHNLGLMGSEREYHCL